MVINGILWYIIKYKDEKEELIMPKPMKILILEDDIEDCNNFINCIKKRDDIVLVAVTDSDIDALKYVKLKHPEGIVLDIELNNAKGYVSFYVDFFEDKDFKKIENRKYVELPTEIDSKITMIEIFDTTDFIDFIDSVVNLEFGDIDNNQIKMILSINDKLIKLEYQGLLSLK